MDPSVETPTLASRPVVAPADPSAAGARGRREPFRRGWTRAMLPSGGTLPDRDWERHHRVVLCLLLALSLVVPAYSALRGYSASHLAVHAAPLVLLTLLAAWHALSRTARAAAAALGLMTASALVVHASRGATEAHFMFFALLPLATVYAGWTPFLLAVGYVAVHHFVVGSLVPGVVFDHAQPVLGTALVHAGFVLAESLACLTAWRLAEHRREHVERSVAERTAELRQQRNELARLALVVESTDDAVITMTTDAVIVTWNRGAERLYGYTAEEAVGQHASMLIHPEGRQPFATSSAALAHGPSVNVEGDHVCKDGSRLDASVTVSNLRDAAGRVTGSVAIARDVSERKRAESEARETARTLEAQAEELTRLALHDPLTGLANRALLHDRLEHALATRPPGRMAVLVLDLDDFKSVNDVAGHAVGDGVLVEAARRLQTCVRPGDTVARLGGDEFVVVVDDVAEVGGAASVAGRILAAMAEPMRVGDERFVIDASIGVTLADDPPGRGPVELLRDADIAMYAAKAGGRGRCQLFEADMHHKIVAHTELVRDLRTAVTEGQLRLLYQPQVDLVSGQMTGVEALVRWQHPDRGLLTPDRFIPAAESSRMILPVDDWVLHEACTQVRAWDDAGLRPLDVAVNVSAHRLVTGDLAGTIATLTRQAGIDPARLEIEITETVAVHHEADAIATITRVRALGVQVAIDDFGMGHSALSRLQNFPVDRVKIDRSFVAPLTEDAAQGSIADAMIVLGRSLGLRVVAEGVESEEHLRALRALGCPGAQGYLFGKPAPPQEIERLATSGAALTPPLDPSAPRAVEPESAALAAERLTRNLLAELQRLTGLESTYLSRIDTREALQHITHARNAGSIDIPEGLTVDWAESVCRRALEQGVAYTDDVSSTFPDSTAGQDLGLQTYISVPVRTRGGELEGMLCGASSLQVPLGPVAVRVMEHYARLIGERTAGVA